MFIFLVLSICLAQDTYVPIGTAPYDTEYTITVDIYSSSEGSCTGDPIATTDFTANTCGKSDVTDYFKADCSVESSSMIYVSCFWGEEGLPGGLWASCPSSCEGLTGNYEINCYGGIGNLVYPKSNECTTYTTREWGIPLRPDTPCCQPMAEWCDWNLLAISLPTPGDLQTQDNTGVQIDNDAIIYCKDTCTGGCTAKEWCNQKTDECICRTGEDCSIVDGGINSEKKVVGFLLVIILALLFIV